MPKISIIIPIYRVEEYIDECINSILEQDCKDIEIILIDDGSPDNCPHICDKYAEEFGNIKVIHKINGGVASARNVGIREARGEYIVFLDSDDWLDIDYIKEIKKAIALDIDVILVKVNSYDNTTQKVREINYKMSANQIYSNIDFFKKIYILSDFWGAAWQFVIKREFIIKNNFYFEEGLMHEDEMYLPPLILQSSQIIFCEKAIYVNRSNREGSIINSYNIKKELDKISIIEKFLNLAKQRNFSNEKGKLLKVRSAQIYMGIILEMWEYYNDYNYKELKEKLERYKYVLKFNNKIKYKVTYLSTIIIGVEKTGKLFNWLKSY